MTIVKALMNDEYNLRLSAGNKWLVYNTTFNMWVVYEQKGRRVVKIIETENQNEAVTKLIS